METKILQEGNPILRQIAKEISIEDIGSKKIKDLIKKMTDVLLNHNNGVALAAPQIGESLRLFIVRESILNAVETQEDPQEENKKILVFINPKITKKSKKQNLMDEGCLSVENIYGKIKRHEKITIEAYNENATKFNRGTSGFFAQIIQHETDHLNGILFIDNAVEIEKIDENISQKNNL